MKPRALGWAVCCECAKGRRIDDRNPPHVDVHPKQPATWHRGSRLDSFSCVLSVVGFWLLVVSQRPADSRLSPLLQRPLLALDSRLRARRPCCRPRTHEPMHHHTIPPCPTPCKTPRRKAQDAAQSPLVFLLRQTHAPPPWAPSFPSLRPRECPDKRGFGGTGGWSYGSDSIMTTWPHRKRSPDWPRPPPTPALGPRSPP